MRWILSLLLLSFFSLEALAQLTPALSEECDRFLKKPAAIRFLDAEATLSQSRFRLNDIPGYDPSAIYLGMIGEARGSGHFYLIAGNQRFDGKAFFMGKAKVKTFRSDQNIVAEKGVVFQIKVPEGSVNKLQEAFEKRPNSFSCLHAACDVLREADIHIGDIQDQFGVRAKRVAQGLLNADVKVGDLQLAPEDVTLFYNSAADFENFLDSAKNLDALTTAQFVGLTVMTTALGTMIVYTIYQRMD